MYQDLENNFDNLINIKEVLKPAEKSEICEMILKNLPEWFGIEEAIKEYMEEVKSKFFLSAYLGNIPVGFIAIKEQNEFTSEIYVLGILKEFHNRGIGKRLVKRAEEKLIEGNKKFLTVKTLSDSHPDEYYKRTRKFYRAMGFFPLEEIKEIWGEANPCLIMIKLLDK